MTSDEAMQMFLETGALLRGHFELRSGLHSDQYFQCALVLRYPRIAAQLCRALIERVREGLGGRLDVAGVMAPAMGGIIVGYEMARELGVVSLFAEKQEGKLALRRGFRIEPGASYLVAEDVITRGGRVQETVDIVEIRGGKVAAVAVLVDRSGGKTRFTHPVFNLLEMDPATYEPENCPLCRQGLPLDHPGS